MNEQDLPGDSLTADDDARAAEEQERLAAGQERDPDGTGEGGDGEGGEARARAHRPGKLERRLARTERERDTLARANSETQRRIADLERRLNEANEAGNKLYARSLSHEIDGAQDELRSAIVAGDADATVTAQRKVSELVAANQMLRAAPAQQQQAPAAPAPASYTPSTAAWLAANPWYGSDPELTQLARSVHAQAVKQGKQVDSPEYWRFVERGVEAISPGTVRSTGHADDDDDDAPPVRTTRQAAAPGVTRSAPRSPSSPDATVHLTAAEADAAKISGMTPQEYKSFQTRLKAAGRIGASR